MAVIQVIVEVTVDGHAIAGSPFVLTLDAQQYALVNIQAPVSAAGAYDLIPGTHGAFPIITGLLLFNVDQALSYRLQGQDIGDIPMLADGFLMALGTNINVGNLNLKANNPVDVCTILGLVAGKGVTLAIPATLVIDERWEAQYPTPNTLLVDERWESSYPSPPASLVIDERWEETFPLPPTTLLIDERWNLGDRICTINQEFLRELFEYAYCDTDHEAFRELFEA